MSANFMFAIAVMYLASCVSFYIDGKYIGRITGTTILPDLTTISLYNTIEAINGPAEDMDMGVVAIWNGTKRYAQSQI